MTYLATATPNATCYAGTTIKLESTITAPTAADAIDAKYQVLMLYHRTSLNGVVTDTHVKEIIVWNAAKLVAGVPSKVTGPMALPDTLPPGQYFVAASVRDVNWHWLPMSQTAILFSVLSAAPGPKPLRAVPTGFLPDDGVSYVLIAGASDDFLGTSLNRNKWWTRYKDNNGTLDHYQNEVGRYVDNHIVTGGELLLTAHQRATTWTAPNGKVYHLYDTSMIRGRTLVERGYIEARIWVPPGQGMFSAFWMLPQYEWPPEIDIMECAFDGGVHEKNTMVHGCETSAGGTLVWHDPAFNTTYNFLTLPAPVSAGYHHYGLLWEDDLVTEWFDGKPMAQKKFGWKTNAGADGGLASVIINLAVGGNWATLNYTQPIASDDQIMRVDYVHVFQRPDAIKTGVSPL